MAGQVANQARQSVDQPLLSALPPLLPLLERTQLTSHGFPPKLMFPSWEKLINTKKVDQSY